MLGISSVPGSGGGSRSSGGQVCLALALVAWLAAGAWADDLLLPSGAGSVGNHRPVGDQVGFTDEIPVHAATTQPMLLAATEITKGQWDAVRAWGLAHGYADLPEGAGGTATLPEEAAGHPVVGVSWYDAVKWCNALSEMEELVPAYRLEDAGRTVFRTGEVDRLQVLWNNSGYRLPTEHEWELAARGGLAGNDFPWEGTSPFYRENISVSQARYQADGTVLRAQYAPNGYGLYDLTGNVAEWCWDWYDEEAYGKAPPAPYGPAEPAPERMRSTRGGSWRSGPADLRVSARGLARPDRRQDHVGFRTARSQVRIDPDRGPLAGGTIITVTNGYFGIITNVLVGGIDVVPAAAGANWFTLAMPGQSAAGTVDLVAQTSDYGEFPLLAGYSYNPAGQIDELGVTPSSGSWTGGYQVVIRGSHLGDSTDISAVSLNGVSVADIVSQSETQVVVVAGQAAAIGLGDVRVFSDSYGETTQNSAFEYVRETQAPLVFAPASPQTFGTTNALGISGGSGTGAVAYEVVSGPGTIVDDTHLAVVGGTGTIQVRATKAQDDLYLAATVTGTVVAAKADPTVSTWPTASAIVYGQTLAESMLSNGTATPAGAFAFATPTAGPAAGTWAESVVFVPADTADFNTTNGTASVTVNKALLTVAADPQRKPYGAANPPLTFTYAGFVAGEDDAVLAVAPTASTTVDETTPVGVYPGAITVAGGVAANYEFHYVAADFTVTEAIDSLVVAALSAASNRVQVTFGPVADGVVYDLQYRPSLLAGDWTVVASLTGVAAPNATLTHTNASVDFGFYRVAGPTGPSARVWGYARVAKPGNSKLSMVGIPFVTSNQTLNSLMGPLQFTGHHLSPGSADQILIWNPASHAYVNLALYDVRSFGAQFADLTGWKPYTNFTGSAYENPVLPTGSAVWIRGSTADDRKVTIAGEVVAAAAATNRIAQGLQMMANPFSQPVGLSHLNVQAHATGHYLSPGAADQIMIWDAGAQTYLNLALYDVASYYGAQYAYLTGWKAYTNFTSGAPYVDPVLPPGQGFWYKAASNDFEWVEPNAYLDALR